MCNGRGLFRGCVISAHPMFLSSVLLRVDPQHKHYSYFTAFTQENESLLNIRLSKCTYVLKKSRKAPKLFNSPILHNPDALNERKQLKSIGRGGETKSLRFNVFAAR